MITRMNPEHVQKNAAIGVRRDSIEQLLYNQVQYINNISTLRSQLMTKVLDPRRDIDLECGYPKEVTIEQYRLMFDREAMAKRVVTVFPEESWAMDPEVYESEEAATETEFEGVWNKFKEDKNVYSILERADVLSGIGRFGIILLGLDDGKPMDQPVEGVPLDGSMEGVEGGTERQVLYMRVFPEDYVTVKQRDVDPNSPRYMQPTLYDINVETVTIPSGQTFSTQRSLSVHWTRIIHLADNRESSEVYGTPRMKVLFNRLYDIRKLAGGSAEMFWKGAFPGFSLEVDPSLQGATLDADSIRDAMEDYQNGLQRYIALQGIKVNPLLPQVTDPNPHLDAQINLICIALGVPKRVFEGSEEAKLASSQDKKTWNGRVDRRRRRYLTPHVLRPFVDRLIAAKVLPNPADGYKVDWPDLNAPSDQERADVLEKVVNALAKYIQGSVDQLIPPEEFLGIFMGMDKEEIDAILKKALDRIDDETDPLEARTLAAKDEEAARMEAEAKKAEAQAATQPPVPAKVGVPNA